ncbi:unnamed protein product, partial [Prorocentrum cordatum]
MDSCSCCPPRRLTVWVVTITARGTDCYHQARRTLTSRPASHARCSYSRDLSRLARWMELHRGSLPGHVLWLDSTPQHGDEYAARNGNGTWRNTLAHQVLSAFAPSVGLVRLQPVLDDRWDSHCSTATAKDGLHWCYESDAFEEYLSTVLTAAAAS